MLKAANGKKVCTGCGLTKDVSEFSRRTVEPDGYRQKCKACSKILNAKYYAGLSAEEIARRIARDKQWKNDHKDRLYGYWVKARLKKLKLTPDDYDKMLMEQNGVCAICEQPEFSVINGRLLPLSVDHNHKTGQVRRLLCGKCNKALGGFNDDVELLKAAIKYLNKYN